MNAWEVIGNTVSIHEHDVDYISRILRSFGCIGCIFVSYIKNTIEIELNGKFGNFFLFFLKILNQNLSKSL